MTATDTTFLGTAVTCMAASIHRLESSDGAFVCTMCSQFKGTWDHGEFNAHINTHHHDSEFISCPYCGCNFPRHFLTSHIASHFHSTYSKFQKSCRSFVNYCPSPECKFQTNDIYALRVHHHFNHPQEQGNYRCYHCSMEAKSLDALNSHITSKAIRLFHCPLSYCTIKSLSKMAIIDHAIRVHRLSSSTYIQATVEYICKYNGNFPSYLHSYIATEEKEEATALLSPKMSKDATERANFPPPVIRRMDNPAECEALCLRCPKCNLSTRIWDRFERHLESCNVLPLSYTIYWCPQCSTVSTERDLIEEHVQEKHSQGSMIMETCCETGTVLKDVKKDSLQSLVIPDTILLSTMASLLTPPSTIPTNANSPLFPTSTSVMSSVKPSTSITTNLPLPDANPLFNTNNGLLSIMMSAFTNPNTLSTLSNNNNNSSIESIIDNLKNLIPNNGQVDRGSNHSIGIGEDPCTPASPSNSVGAFREDEKISFSFDEELFRNENNNRCSSDTLESLVELLHKSCSYVIRIIGKERNRKVPQCPVCNRIFNYGLPDFKRHLLAMHLDAPRDHIKDLTKYLRSSKVESAATSSPLSPSLSSEEQEKQATMRQWRSTTIEPGVVRIPLPYSITVLERLLVQDDEVTPEQRVSIMEKMKIYCTMKAITETRDGVRRHKCCQCKYLSPHALADVRKHIMGSHCGISTKHFRHCLQASRLDNSDFGLLSDDRLIRMAHDSRSKRHENSTNNINIENDESEAGSLADVKLNHSTPSPESREPDENGISRFTTMIPGSKTPVKVRIRGPIPPGEAVVNSIPMTQSSISLNPSTSNEVSDSSSTIDLAELVKENPALAGADRIVDLPLPYSKNVLRKLLENAGATPKQIVEINEKMEVYSLRTMKRICAGDKTLAFRCSCKRLFVTSRQPDAKMRPATLADSRRHVMGVHAKISHEFITICCQASRICRENGFELFNDEMLFRLAMDRPIKLNTTDASSDKLSSHQAPRTASSRSSNSRLGSLPPLRPLADISAENSEEERSAANNRFSLPSVLHDSSVVSNGGLDDEDSEELIDMSRVLSCLNEQDPESIERIIDLPYSKTALESLVHDYCPENYFLELKKKMQIYTKYKVFVQRRNKRRYFCCSGCPSISPHGMGDIRKHILGVHAKVPERYKAAAMHCSRLSREDNTLLSDDNLLQLAKMKWKGTVIRPLSEISMVTSSEVPSTSRYQRSSVNKLPELDSTASATPVVLNRTLKGREAIPFYSCSACRVASEDPAAMRSHVVREHLGVPPYECPECTEAFITTCNLVTHCVSAHENCIPTIPPTSLATPFRLAMQSVSINNHDTPISPSELMLKEEVAKDDEDMGQLWTSWNLPSSFNVTPRVQEEESSCMNGKYDEPIHSSPAVFPTTIDVKPTPAFSKNGGAVGSSRRKPAKANLVQLKQPPKMTTIIDPFSMKDGDDEGEVVVKEEERDDYEIPLKKPRLDGSAIETTH
nr:Zinc finger C2H2 [Hymenolepis microstoma]